MSEELKVTKESVERAAEKCPQAKTVLTEMFPNVFPPKEEWEDVTGECVLRTYLDDGPFIAIYHKRSTIGVLIAELYDDYSWRIKNSCYRRAAGRIWRRK